MTEVFWSSLVSYGPTVLAWALAGVALVGAWAIRRLGIQRSVALAFGEIMAHARAIVLEVFQTFVEAIKAGRADGELTPAEAKDARDKALAKLRSRVSGHSLIAAGGGLLAKWLGGSKWKEKIDEMLGGAIETAVAESKRDGASAGQQTTGKALPAMVSLPATTSPPPTTASEPVGGPPISPR